ncbi:PREDICTED: protein FAM217B [Miniopterus natalensis]|uniref:protein FAM217B n=1 Tax=Miniopterus natalensis TaxID=291302 RepID=UPI0007A6AEE3|nr:PREDICTED: protein FAM217B [Miniopterus natalensis]
MDAGPAWNKAPRSKNGSGKRQSASQAPHGPCRPKSVPRAVSPPAGHDPGGGISPGGKAERSPLGCRGASGNKLLLDFQSLRLMRGDADEDSASDLSDSERVPIAPAPRAPPDLRLRAEEIDPVSFDRDLQPGQGHAAPQDRYPDFLPPPCDSWDLRDMAVLVNTERRPRAAPRAGGLLGKYVDRLVQLEWLQILTVQGERAKGAKPPGVLSARRLCAQQQGRDAGAQEKRGASARPAPWGPAGGFRMESDGNLRIPTRAAGILHPADPNRASKTQAHANLKKKGNANSCGLACLSSEKKLKTSGGKQNTHKFN